MGIAAPRTERDHAMKAAFDAGWDGALDEAILIAEMAVLRDGSAKDVLDAVREFRDVK